MRQPEVIITNIAMTLIQWVIRTQRGWIIAAAGAALSIPAVSASAVPSVMVLLIGWGDTGAPSRCRANLASPHNLVTRRTRIACVRSATSPGIVMVAQNSHPLEHDSGDPSGRGA